MVRVTVIVRRMRKFIGYRVMVIVRRIGPTAYLTDSVEILTDTTTDIFESIYIIFLNLE